MATIPEALTIALQHHRAGRLQEAETIYRQILQVEPNHADALQLLGMIAHQAGRHDVAADYLRQAIKHNPQGPHYYSNLGAILQAQGKLEDAVVSYRQALALKPAYAEAHYNLGNVLKAQGKPVEALGHYRQALSLNPSFADAHHNIGTIFMEQGRLEEAVACYRQALALKPDFVEAYNNLGNILRSQGKLEEAIALYEQGLAVKPDSALTKSNLLTLLGDLAEWEKIRSHLSKWQAESLRIDASKVSGQPVLLPLAYYGPFVRLDRDIQKSVLLSCGRYFADFAGSLLPEGFQYLRNGDRLKVGYVSPNFGDHPVSHVMQPVFEFRNRKKFEIFCYSLQDRRADPGGYLENIMSRADLFCDISALSDVAAARLINSHGIHILVDLTGYMAGSRPLIFALKPAPIQVYWIGHGGKLYAPFIDYVIGDPVVFPVGSQDDCGECVVRMPNAFQPADCPEISTIPQNRADYGLPDEGFVYCGFNATKKIDAAVFGAWMRILRAVPRSVLWLSGAHHIHAQKNLRAAAQAAGIDAQRLVFATRVADKSVHLARHRLAGLFLDTFTVNASTTALDALWAGLPILTLRGDDYFSRIGASQLTAIGLQDMVCDTVDDYINKAVRLAEHPKELNAVRARLQRNRTGSRLFDRPGFADRLEWAYAKMWRMHEAGEGRQAFDVPARLLSAGSRGMTGKRSST
jgi:predicted O-linked N-acetylglucosamine transferase (SPINDLY family)